MKKMLFMLLAGFFISVTALAQNYTATVYGNVMVIDQNSFIPVPDQAVIITIDSSGSGFTYQNTVYTNDAGYYEDIIDIPGFMGNEYVQAMTYDSCMNQYLYEGQFLVPGAQPFPMDFYLCSVISPYCQAFFYYYQNDPADPLTYAFFNASAGDYTDVTWDFGDSTFSSELNPVHTYADTGYYMVCLTISDSMGMCTNTYCEDIFTGFPPPPSECESFILPLNMYGLTVDFEGYTVSPFETDYTWEFGDGTTATGQFVSHTYTEAGMYNVTLETVDTTGCEFQTFMQIWIDTLYQGCSNFFSYEQSDSLTFTFTGEVYLNNGGPFTDSLSTYLWDFGDGTTGTGQTITHTFPVTDSAEYTVCLTTNTIVPGDSACSAVSCQSIFFGTFNFAIYGSVYLGQNMVADEAIVHLMTMDTLFQGVVEIQSTTIDSGGFYSFADMPVYNDRLYYVQAELTEGSAYFGQYVPTYHISSLSWEEAMPILPLMNWTADIFMLAGSPVDGGNGVITGVVSELGTRGTMNDVEVVLMDEEGNPLMYLRSDEQGMFTFNELPMGTYIIHAEIMGIHTIQAAVTLSAENPEASVEVQVSSGEANIVFGVGEPLSLGNVGDIYPNPINELSKLDISVNKPVNVKLSVFGQSGQLIQSASLSLETGIHSVPLDMNDSPAGLYLLRISTDQGESVSRKLMKVR